LLARQLKYAQEVNVISLSWMALNEDLCFRIESFAAKRCAGFFPKFRSLFSLKIKVNAVANICALVVYT
jgi:hypothetical protein